MRGHNICEKIVFEISSATHFIRASDSLGIIYTGFTAIIILFSSEKVHHLGQH